MSGKLWCLVTGKTTDEVVQEYLEHHKEKPNSEKGNWTLEWFISIYIKSYSLKCRISYKNTKAYFVFLTSFFHKPLIVQLGKLCAVGYRNTPTLKPYNFKNFSTLS